MVIDNKYTCVFIIYGTVCPSVLRTIERSKKYFRGDKISRIRHKSALNGNFRGRTIFEDNLLFKILLKCWKNFRG